MALECSITYSDGISGSNTKKGREKSSVVIEFKHKVYSPIDTQRGIVSGARVHGAVEVVKEIDTATASLCQAMCQGQTLSQLVIHWFRITPKGTEEEYFTHTLTNVKVAAVQIYLPNTKDPALERQTHLEKLDLLYEQIQWTHVEGFEFIDSWSQKV